MVTITFVKKIETAYEQQNREIHKSFLNYAPCVKRFLSPSFVLSYVSYSYLPAWRAYHPHFFLGVASGLMKTSARSTKDDIYSRYVLFC